MQCCGQILQDSFDTLKTFLSSVNPEFERKADVHNRTFWWKRFQHLVFFIVIKLRRHNTILQ